jgi:hypothetical protein
VAGTYRLRLAKADTATPEAAPEVLLDQQFTLTNGGIYTLLIADSPGGVQPLQLLSIDDDPAP